MEKVIDMMYSYALEYEGLGRIYVHDEEKYEEESKLYSELERSFTKEQIAIFEKFFELFNERKYFENKHTFHYGFKKGARLAFEVFEEK